MGVFSIYPAKKAARKDSTVAIREPIPSRAVGVTSDINQSAKGNSIFSGRNSKFEEELSRDEHTKNSQNAFAPLHLETRKLKRLHAC